MAFSTGSAGQANAVRGPSVIGSIEDFDAVLQRGDDYANRLSKISDRICGSGPAELLQPSHQGGAIPHSVIASINERRSRLVELLDRIERSIGQLENVL